MYMYIEVDGVPVSEPDAHAWARWMETAKVHVGDDWVDDVRVSTVFLGLDFNYPFTVEQELLVFHGGDCQGRAS